MFNFLKRKIYAYGLFQPQPTNHTPELIKWRSDTSKIKNLIDGYFHWAHSIAEEHNEKYLVVIIPWLGTPAPWYALILGLFLKARGHEVTYVLDDYPMGNKNPAYCEFQLQCIRWILEGLSTKFPVLILSKINSISLITPQESSLIESLASLNAIWEFKGEMVQDGREEFTAAVCQQLEARICKINAMLNCEKYQVAIIPGGIWGSSGIWLKKAKDSNIRVVTYDSGGYGSTMLASNGIACQLQDIPNAFHKIQIETISKESLRNIHQLVKLEINHRKSGTDIFSSQLKNSSTQNHTQFKDGILITLNSAWDSAALGLHGVFKNSTEWIIETIKAALENTSNSIIVRQHPAERSGTGAFMTNENYEQLLQENFGHNPRVILISAGDEINSYELFNQVKIVVAHTSTIALEATIFGVPVITPSNAYWSTLGFVYKAENKAAYIDYLIKGANSTLTVTDQMKTDAVLCYYLAQCCNWIFTPFNVEGFDEYSKLSLKELFDTHEVQMMINSISSNTPYSYLKYRALLPKQEI